MESELYKAAAEGNVPFLLELLRKDRLLLDRIMTGIRTETPLHIAAMIGHLGFVDAILARKPELAKEQDSEGFTPLHLAAANGYLNIVVRLLTVAPDICFYRDKYERNPLHVAAMRGRVEVLELLVQTTPDAALRVIEHGQMILHLCVKHYKLEALKLLIDKLGDDRFINSRDEDGNTILHLAAADRQTKTIHFLTSKGVNQNITNSRGFTALALLTQGESVGIAMLTMWLATAFMAVTYALTIFAFTPEDDEETGSTALKFAMGAWAALNLLVALLFVCFIPNLVREVLKFVYSALKKQKP